MSLAFVGITLNIRNNRTYPIRINVLGSPFNPLDTANATTEYRWDITAFAPSNDDVLTLEYKPVGAAVFSTFTYQIYNTNTEALISALDSLGIGYFQSYTELGQLYLSTYNDNYVFGLLTITNNGTPATSTTTTSTTAAPTTSTTSTTTAAPTTSTTSTTTAAPTSTTTTSTTAAPTSTTTTTTAAPTSTTTTTTTVASYTYALGVDGVSGNGACLDFTISPVNYYSASIGLNNGVVLYQDPALSTLVPDNYYSDGVQNWLVTGGNGTLTAETLCSITTTTTSTTTAAPTTTTSTTTAAPTSTTTTTTTATPTSTTTTTTTSATPTFVWNTNSAAVSAGAACSATKDVYLWTFGNAWGAGIVYYAGTALAPLAPLQVYLGGDFFYENGGVVINIDDNGVSSNLQPCPATTSTTTSTTTAAPTSTTTTSTTAAVGGFTISNPSGSGQIDNVTTTGGASFYVINSGSFPVTTGASVVAGLASLTGDPVIVDISSYTLNSCLSLYINGIFNDSITVTASGTYTFTNKTFSTSDTVLLEYVSGICI